MHIHTYIHNINNIIIIHIIMYTAIVMFYGQLEAQSVYPNTSRSLKYINDNYIN